jgi:hypothetical protein
MGLCEPHVPPGLTAVDRLVDAVAPRRALSVVRLARAGPHDVAVGRRDGDIANRERSARLVEHGLPGDAVVHGLEEPARRGGHEDGGGVARRHIDVVDAAAERRGPDVAPREAPFADAAEHGAAGLGHRNERRRQQGRQNEHE